MKIDNFKHIPFSKKVAVANMAEVSIIRTVAGITNNLTGEVEDHLTLGVISIKSVGVNSIEIKDDSTEDVTYIHDDDSQVPPAPEAGENSSLTPFDKFLNRFKNGELTIPASLSIEEDDDDMDDLTFLFSMFLIWKVLKRELTGTHTVCYDGYYVMKGTEKIGTLSHVTTHDMLERFEDIVNKLQKK